MCKNPVMRVHLRRDALTPAHDMDEGVGGNGAAIQTGDPEGRERSQTGYARCLTVENELLLAKKHATRASKEEFEEWLKPFVQKIKKVMLYLDRQHT